MPVVKCPMESCAYQTDDVSEALAVTLLSIHSNVHITAQTSNQSVQSATSKLEQVKRPSIRCGGTSEDWTYFLARWGEYTRATKVAGEDLVIQLLECCEEELRKDLTRTAGGSLATKDETTVLNAIKQLAVREENVMIARMELFNMRQDHNESIRSFGARIRGQADTCKYI